MARLPPQRVERFQGCNGLKLGSWHMAVWTENQRFGFRFGVYSVFLTKNLFDSRAALCQNSFLAHGGLDLFGYLQPSVASSFPLLAYKSAAVFFGLAVCLWVGRWVCVCVCVFRFASVPGLGGRGEG